MRKTLSGVTVKDESQGQVSAVFATFNVIDRDGDLTLPGAIKDGTEVVISAYGHSSHDDELPVGKGVIRTTDTEAILEGQFFMNTTAGRETFEVVKELGPLGEWSYSLSDVTRTSVESDGRYYWIIESIGLIKEVSPVLMGAGINTRTLSAKGLGMKFSEEGDAVVAAVDDYLGRAREVMVLRAEKGRALSDDTKALLTQLDASLKSLHALLTPEAESAAEGTPEDIKAMAATRLQADLFSNLNTEGARP
jgi:hypothetical protein